MTSEREARAPKHLSLLFSFASYIHTATVSNSFLHKKQNAVDTQTFVYIISEVLLCYLTLLEYKY